MTGAIGLAKTSRSSRMSADACRLVRFEDAVASPDGTARDLLRFLDLNEERYPFERIGDVSRLSRSRSSTIPPPRTANTIRARRSPT